MEKPIMDSTMQLAMQALKIKKPVDMRNFLKQCLLTSYLEGAKIRTFDDDHMYLKVKKNTIFECECPHCQEYMELMLQDLMVELLDD